MKAVLNQGCYLGAALVLAAAGIAEVIDQTTMITLIVVLTVCLPNARGACAAQRRA